MCLTRDMLPIHQLRPARLQLRKVHWRELIERGIRDEHGNLLKLFLTLVGKSNFGLGLSDPGDNLVCDIHARRDLPLPIPSTKKRYGSWQLIWHAKGVLFHSRI